MNYIGIDISLSSTGVYILKSDNTEIYFNYMNKDKLSKWHKTLSFINYKNYKNVKSNIYSDSEVLKIMSYDLITNQIIKDILDNCIPEETIIVTEGYSYSSSNTSSLIDLVAFASLLRSKIISYNFHDFRIKSPSTLKVDACELTYITIIPPIQIGKNGKPKKQKKIVCKNKLGIAGGKFTKHDMLDAILENTNINIQIKQILLPHKKELQLMKSIPKPIDDMIDACWLAISELEKDKN